MPAKSQWNFGELFPTEAVRRVLSVSELTTQIKRLLEKQIGTVWVSGEITNFRSQSSGHLYFTLKDASAQLNCVLFRNEPVPLRHLLQDGRMVTLQGELTVYEPRGQHQLIVHAVELMGEGALQAAFERLKQKLSAEGLFAPGRKRPMPRYPRRIGLVTSPTGAAIRDVIHVIQRRQPGLEIVLVPCRVQGDGAAREIAAGIRLLNEWSEKNDPSQRLDAILVTRGGGSLEDLWAFNEEEVARAIYGSKIPVVSAVGHEIDFTISDFVADLRAATPSVGAELLTEGAVAGRQIVAEAVRRMVRQARQHFQSKQEQLEQCSQRLLRAHPRRRLNEKFQRLDDLRDRLHRAVRVACRNRRSQWEQVAGRLLRTHPGQTIPPRREALKQLEHRLAEVARFRMEQNRHRMEQAIQQLRLLSPRHVLKRGYSITREAETGRILRAAVDARPGLALITRLGEGEVRSVVTPDKTA